MFITVRNEETINECNENEVKSWTKWFIKLITNEVKYLIIHTALIKQLKLCFANEVRSERSERRNVVSAIWLTNVVIAKW